MLEKSLWSDRKKNVCCNELISIKLSWQWEAILRRLWNSLSVDHTGLCTVDFSLPPHLPPLLPLSLYPLPTSPGTWLLLMFNHCWPLRHCSNFLRCLWPIFSYAEGKGEREGKEGEEEKKRGRKRKAISCPCEQHILTGDSASLGSLVPSFLLPHVLLHKRVLIRGPITTIWKCCAHA